MNRIVEALAQWVGTDRNTALAERIAGRSRLGVWQRVKDRLPELAPQEARGYLRARAISVVHEQTTQLIEQEGRAIEAHRAYIEEAAIQLLIKMICAQGSQRRTQQGQRQAA